MEEPLDEAIGENKGVPANGFNGIVALARCILIVIVIIGIVQRAFYSFSFGDDRGQFFAFLAGLLFASSLQLLFLYYNFRHAKVEFISTEILPQFRRPFIIVAMGYLIFSLIDNFQMIGMHIDYGEGYFYPVILIILLIAKLIILRQEFRYLGVRQVRQ